MRGEDDDASVPGISRGRVCACDRSIGYLCGACQLRMLGLGIPPALVGYVCHKGKTHSLSQVIVAATLSICECGTFRLS